MKSYLLFFILVALSVLVQAQTSWKLIHNKDGIKVYLSGTENSKFKSIRVQTIFDGTIPKLMNILGNIRDHPEWVYKAKSASVLKQVNPYEYIYYTESILPWPLSNRDAIIHLTLMPDANHRMLRVTAISEPYFIGVKEGLVRIPYSKATWYVTESINKINIDYIFEVDPGGDLPAWLVNTLADKGPLESFQKLRLMLNR